MIGIVSPEHMNEFNSIQKYPKLTRFNTGWSININEWSKKENQH